jgi:hypothetical protein
VSGREASDPQVHDNIVLGYSVSSERRELVIHTEYQDREPTELTDIVFRGVEAYHLIGDTLRSVLFDVEESPLGQIIGEFSAVFEEGARYSWPGTWNRSPESCLLHFRELGCRGWVVSASCGLWGFVIAREIEIRDAGGSGEVRCQGDP